MNDGGTVEKPIVNDSTYTTMSTGVLWPTVFKDINWRKYIPAEPPASGEYIVIAYDPQAKTTTTLFSTYKYEERYWDDVWHPLVVTHYARIELPE